MAKFFAIFVAIFLCMMVIAPLARGITCDMVLKNLQPCSSALQKGGAVTQKCCNGISSLNRAANTVPARKSACECIKKLAKSYKVKSQTAASVTKKCNVNIGYPISSNVDCSRVH